MMKMFWTMALIAVSVTAFAQKKKMAVVTFYADKQVDMSDVGLPEATVIAELTKNPAFNLQPMVQQYHEKFFTDFAPRFPFDLVEESAVTGNEGYQAYKPDYQGAMEATRYEAFSGYKAIDHNWGKENEKAMVKMFNEYDGVMFVRISFSLDQGFGIGGTSTTKMRAFTNIALFNKKGEKVFSINENANSKKTGVMVGGVPVITVEKIMPMCQSALDELMKDLDKRIEKIVDKSAKKL